MHPLDAQFTQLTTAAMRDADSALARKHAPLILFDFAEPFLPLAVGYTLFYESADSPSFPRRIELAEAEICAIEYAIWWDWDIEHLYELEHVWVYLNADDQVIRAEASWHGGYRQAVVEPGAHQPVTLFSEPGKHAFASQVEVLIERQPTTLRGCTSHRAPRGLLVTPLFRGIIPYGSPTDQQLVQTYLERHLFTPTYTFSQAFALRDALFVPWANLKVWIPERIRVWLDHLAQTIPYHERRVQTIAHRGASAYAEENSAKAFSIAAELGADFVEVDLRVTIDHVPVIAHDDSLRRVYGVEGLISELLYEQLRVKAPVLTFDELLAQCQRLNLGIYLDIKALSAPAAQRVTALVDDHGYRHRVLFASFRPDIVAEIKAHRPDLMTSILFASPNIEPVALAQSLRADFVHPCWEAVSSEPHLLLTDDWLNAVRGAGLGIITWTEERPQVIAGLKARGVIGICSDRPETVIAAGKSVGG
jgi:glycerophosphoryl diester phosphodiesterase